MGTAGQGPPVSGTRQAAKPGVKPGGKPGTKPGLMRSLGLFVGHVARAIRTDVAANPDKQSKASSTSTREEIRRTTSERRVDPAELREVLSDAPHAVPSDQARADRAVILRRTVIDEIELREGGNAGSNESGVDSQR